MNSALERCDISTCKGSSSPKLDNAEALGDDEFLSEDPTAKCRSAVLMLLSLPNERSDITSTARLVRSRLKTPCQLVDRQLKKLLRYIQDTKHAATEFKPAGVDPR